MHFQKGFVSLLFSCGLSCMVVPSAWGQGFEPSLSPTGPDSTPHPTLSVLSVVDLGDSTLSFEWGGKTPALAVIKSNEKWWIVFDESAKISLSKIKETPIPGVRKIDIVPTKGGQVVLRVIVEPEITPLVNLVHGVWQVSFKHQPFNPQHQLSIQLPKSNKDSLVVGLEAPGKEVLFTDPHTGFMQVVIPSYRVGLGVVEESIFPEFQVLASTQGVGIQVLKDDMAIAVTSEQVTIMHPEGLAITLPQEREQVRTRAIPIGVFVDAQDLDWTDRRQKINEELLDLPHSQHGPGELELAWLLLSSGQSSEALGYLTHLAQERPSIASLPLFQILQGLSNLLVNRFNEAENQLLLAGEEPEVQIWLSVIKAIQDPHYLSMSPILLSQFRSQLLKAKSMLQSYPKPLRNQMVSLILLAGIATKHLEALSSILDQEIRPENLREAEVFDLAKARVLMSQNKPDAALQIMGELMEKAASPQIRAIAHFDYVAHRWETNMMKKEDALLELERIRSPWRGKWLGHEITAYLERRDVVKPTTE